MATTDVYPGKDLGTLELTITDEMVHHYIKGLDEPNPWYTTASPVGRTGGSGDRLRSARVADRYRRRDREVVAQEMWVRDEAGHLIARSIHHQSFLAEQTSGEVTLRDPTSKEGARQEGEPSGQPLSVELHKTFTEAMCNEFFFRSRNYHNDKAASNELGFGDTVIGGRMTLSCVTELLDPAFRPRLLPGRPPGREVHQRAVAERALHDARDHHGPSRRGRPDARRRHGLLREG